MNPFKNVEMKLEGGESIMIHDGFVEWVNTLKPLRTDKTGVVTCKKGKLINHLGGTDRRYRQTGSKLDFTLNHLEWVYKVPFKRPNGLDWSVPLGGQKGWGLSAVVDAFMLPHVENMKWHFNQGYAKSGGKLMHRVVMAAHLGDDAIEGFIVDHIDGNRLNNRMSNLRLKTPKGNAKNKTNDPRYENLVGVRETTSGMFETVHKNIPIIHHTNSSMCALCYDSVVTYCYGPGARVNDNKSNAPLPITYWSIPEDVMMKLNKLREKAY